MDHHHTHKHTDSADHYRLLIITELAMITIDNAATVYADEVCTNIFKLLILKFKLA